MEFGILSSIDESMKEALAYKSKIMSIQKVLEIYVNKELSNNAKASKRFSFTSKSKFSELPNDSYLGHTIHVYTEIEAQRIQYKSKMLNEIKSNVLHDYTEFINKFPPLTKIRQKLGNMHNQMKNNRNKAKPGGNEPIAEASNVEGNGLNLVQVDSDVLQNEFMKEAKSLKKLVSDLIVDEKNILTLIAKTLHYELEYHNSCVSLIDTTVVNIAHKLNVNKSVFGVALETHLQREECEISHVINDCICYLINYELDEPGLFRLAPSDIKIKKLVAIFDTGMQITKEYVNTPNVVATCLKRYLLRLPIPLIPFDMYNDFKQLILSSKNVPVDEMKKLIDKIPQPFHRNLHYLMAFLKLVASHSAQNKMDEMNLGIVFGPAILRKNLEIDNTHDLSFCDKDVATFIIKHCDELFPSTITLNTKKYYRFILTDSKSSYGAKNTDNADGGEHSKPSNLKKSFADLALSGDNEISTKPPYHIVNQNAYNQLNEKKK